MRSKSSSIIIILLLIIIALLAYNTFSHKGNTTKSEVKQTNSSVANQIETQTKPQVTETSQETSSQEQSIEELTNEKVIVPFVKEHGKLPDYYITKQEAKSQGWNPSQGNLCDVLPGRAIGGDIFTNRERSLPSEKGRIWYEADLNYNCGNRNADRLLYSNDGLVFVTHNHYKSFEQQ